jgi:hypothetical protein
MSNLETFLKHNIEDYLIHDLRKMQRIEVTYPLLMTTFAGIELLGAIFSKSTFDTNSGDRYFRSYWNQYLYPTLANKEAIGEQLYKLLRHGIAHAFLLKGSVFVGRSQPSDHLTRNADGVLYVDAVLMADHFVASYDANVKPIVTVAYSNVVLEMSKRMGEIKSKYEEQAGKHDRSIFPIGTVATTAAVSHSFDPRSKTKGDS